MRQNFNNTTTNDENKEVEGEAAIDIATATAIANDHGEHVEGDAIAGELLMELGSVKREKEQSPQIELASKVTNINSELALPEEQMAKVQHQVPSPAQQQVVVADVSLKRKAIVGASSPRKARNRNEKRIKLQHQDPVQQQPERDTGSDQQISKQVSCEAPNAAASPSGQSPNGSLESSSSSSASSTSSSTLSSSSSSTSSSSSSSSSSENICAACSKPIKERYLLMALDKQWHEDCLKCACCDCRLGEVGSSLFTHSDKILCRRDFLRIFGQHGRCAACKKSIPPYEMVMRANQNAYHMDCFACQQCQYRFCVGDRFHLTEAHRVVCILCYAEQQQPPPPPQQSRTHHHLQHHQHHHQPYHLRSVAEPQPQQSDGNILLGPDATDLYPGGHFSENSPPPAAPGKAMSEELPKVDQTRTLPFADADDPSQKAQQQQQPPPHPTIRLQQQQQACAM